MHELQVARRGPLSLLVGCPLFWAAIGTTAVVAICILGVLFGIAAAFGAASVSAVAAHRPEIHRQMQRSARAAAWRSRCEQRETRLDDARELTEGLQAATRIVEELEACDPQLSTHLELEALLDHYVDVALRAKRCERALDMSRRLRDPLFVSSHRDINERLVAGRKELKERLQRLRDELEAIPELLGLVVQRVTLESTERIDDPVGDRLALLEENAGAIAAAA
jgi:hypothetical protein